MDAETESDSGSVPQKNQKINEPGKWNLNNTVGRKSEPNYIIIKEIYGMEHTDHETQLEDALVQGKSPIVIEPLELGDETARWITIGNSLHKTAVIGGLAAVVASLLFPSRPAVFIPPTLASVFSAGLYAYSWRHDPCAKYQVESNPRELCKVPLPQLGSISPVVIVRKDDSKRRALQNSLATISAASVLWRLFALQRAADPAFFTRHL